MKGILAAPLALLLAAGAHAQIADYQAFERAGKPAQPAGGGANTQPAGLVTTFASRGEWFAATGVSVLEDFEGGLTPPGGLNNCDAPVSSASNDACFQPGNLVSGFRLEIGGQGPRGGGEFVVLGDGFIGQPTAVIGPNSFEDFTNLVFTNGAVNAVAFDGFSGAGGAGDDGAVGGSGVNVRIFDAADALIDSFFVATPAFNESAFVGFLSPVTIGRVEIEGNLDTGELIDGLAFGTASSVEAVAVPATGVFGNTLLAALLLLGGLLIVSRQAAPR